MDMYPRYQSRSGYFNQDDQTDGYGVDHSGFSLRDELLYQTARTEREQELFENFNRQGVDENYPRLGTGFWENFADNYGFGRSNIENNIKKRQFTPVPDTSIQNAAQKRAMMMPTQSRNDFISSFETKTSDRVKRLYPETSPAALIVRLAQNNVNNMISDAGVKSQITFDDVYWGDDGRKNTHQIEGGYSNRTNDSGGPTNFAVTQATLDEYNHWKSSLKKGIGFPADVRDLTHQQVRQILNERFYQAYNIKALQNLMIARSVFDGEINQGTNTGKLLADTVNEYFNTALPRNMVISDCLAEKINNLSDDEAVKINDLFLQKRMNSYFNTVDAKPQNINNLKSWYNRAANHYSNQRDFDKLYKSKLEYYLNKKYRMYYNGM